MTDFPKKLTLEPCGCDYDKCQRTGFKEGTFYQGNGFDRPLAEEIARRYNDYERLKELERLTRRNRPI